MKLIIVEEGRRTEQTFDLAVVRVGRSLDNDVRLRDKHVSRNHCRIERVGADWILVDLDTRNGTLVNGQRANRRPLRPGDVIQIGESRICFEAPAPSQSAAPGRETAIIEAAPVHEDTVSGTSSQERDNLLVLQKINRQLNSTTELEPLLALIVDSAILLSRAERGFVILDRGGELVTQVARNFMRQDMDTEEFAISRTIADQVLATGRPVLSVNAQDDQRFATQKSVVNLHLRSVLCVPLRIQDRLGGLIYVDNRLQESVFTDRDLELLEALADQAGIAVANARLLADLRARNEDLSLHKEELERLNRALGERVDRSEKELVRTRRALADAGPYPGIIGASPAMQAVFRALDRIVTSEYPVLVSGASGTGKELVARAIHRQGARAEREFVSENCGALPDTLLESELFGHTRGAFTGAHKAKRGLLEKADGGTLFLDEVSEMSPEMQKKLLRVLQEGEFRPVGSDEAVQVDVRLIAASNRNLIEMVKAGEFREDLYYRLKVLDVQLPPLKRRREDIPLLITHFLDRFSRETGSRPRTLDPEALERCVDYPWPGNVRELQNEVRKWIVLADDVVRVEHLSESLRNWEEDEDESGEAGGGGSGGDEGSLPERIARLEIREIRRTLRRYGNNKSRAAESLGISRFALQRKMEKYELDREEE